MYINGSDNVQKMELICTSSPLAKYRWE